MKHKIGGIKNMKGRGVDSEYLITRLFSMDYFHYFSKPLIFAAYFFPFVALGKGIIRAYTPEEFEEKIANIRENKHGNYYNYATQGFGTTPFYEPDVSYAYFYSKLCTYDQEKGNYFFTEEVDSDSLEADSTRQDLRYVLKKKRLLLKRGTEVSENVKNTLLYELNTSEVKTILAKLLYYIVSPKHVLPDITLESSQTLSIQLNTQFHTVPNIRVDFRSSLDESTNILSDRMRKAKEIQICCIDGVSLFGGSDITPAIQQSIIDTLYECVVNNPNFIFELLLSEYESESFRSVAKYQVNIPHLRYKKRELPSKTILQLEKFKHLIPSFNLGIKLTDLPLPYALFIMRFDDESLDYVKVDMYSPMIDDNKDRPCFYVFKRTDPLLFQHFIMTFDKMWKNDDYSHFIERDDDPHQ